MNRSAHTHQTQEWTPHPDLLPCGIVRTNEKQRIVYVNHCLLEWLGHAASHVLEERPFTDLLSVGGRILFETHHYPRLEMEGEIAELQYDLLMSGGGRFSATINARKDAAGCVYVILPFSDRKKLEHELRIAKEKAEAADRAKSSFLSIMSHEIRTPLYAIIEGGNFLLKENPRPDQLELIQAQRAAGENLLTIVNDILDISKLESGKLQLVRKPFRIADLLDSVVSVYAGICRQKGVDFRVEGSTAGIPDLLGDPVRLGQVLTNLVSNAAKFTAAGEVVLTVRHQPEDGQHRLFISVRDSGIGIEPDRLEAVFEPFTQASVDTQIHFGGTGLGLAICQRILLAYGTRMQVSSTVGEGTTFNFDILLPAAPVSEEEEESVATAERPVPESSLLNHLRVLNVDDNSANLLINARYFTEWGLDFAQYSDATTALAALEEKSFDLVLLDLRMPGMDGYEMARRIRQHANPAIAGLPLIALSASSSNEVNAKMMAAGINGLVLKPFRPSHLLRIIREYGENKNKLRFKAEPTEESLLMTNPNQRFAQAREIFAGSDADYLSFLKLIHGDVNEFLEELTRCSQDFSEKRFFMVRHNLLSTVRVFDLQKVKVDLNDARDLLKNGQRVPFVAKVSSIKRQLNKFTSALRDEMATLATVKEAH